MQPHADRPSSPARPIAALSVCLTDGSRVTIRQIEETDLALEQDFLRRLSPEFHAYRFLGLIRDPDETDVRDLIHTDPECEVSLAAIARHDGMDCQVGVARFRRNEDGDADCAVTIDPQWQRLGLGRLLMARLIEAARIRGVRRLFAIDAARSAGSHRLAERLGFRSCPEPDDPAVLTYELDIR